MKFGGTELSVDWIVGERIMEIALAIFPEIVTSLPEAVHGS